MPAEHTVPLEDARSVLGFVERRGIKLALEILAAAIGDLVISFINPINEFIFNHYRQPSAHPSPIPIYISPDSCWAKLQPGVENFQYPLVGGVLHPFAGLSHQTTIFYHIHTCPEMSEGLDSIVERAQRYRRKLYNAGTQTDVSTRSSRGPDFLSGPKAECGPVVGTPGPRGSRRYGTPAMYDDNTRRLEASGRRRELRATNTAPSPGGREMEQAPDQLVCASCGSPAKRCTWGDFRTAYRCTGCHAGGHIAERGGEVFEQGGVFERLENFATRGARA